MFHPAVRSETLRLPSSPRVRIFRIRAPRGARRREAARSRSVQAHRQLRGDGQGIYAVPEVGDDGVSLKDKIQKGEPVTLLLPQGKCRQEVAEGLGDWEVGLAVPGHLGLLLGALVLWSSRTVPVQPGAGRGRPAEP